MVRLLIRGQGGPVDPGWCTQRIHYRMRPKFAARLQQFGCLGGIQGKGGARDTAQALAAFKKACQGGYQQGCKNVTQLTKELGSK